MHKKAYFVFSLVMLAMLVITQVGLAAPAAQTTGATPTPETSWNINFDAIASLRDMPQLDPQWTSNFVIGRKWLPNRPTGQPGGGSDLIQGSPAPGALTPMLSFEGVNNVNGVLPPDTNGDIGPNHYVQTVNLAFAIYDRQGNKLYGPANINTLWQGFGGYCESSNDGDPIVLYDHLADRWFISQFALPRYPFGPFYQCIAVSQTPDPTGAWYRYAFVYSKTKMNDYPHFGVWQNGYYMSVNQFNSGQGTWAGQGVAVFEREKMLTGQAARMIQFDLYSTDSNLGGMQPSHLNGPAPAAGTDNVFAEIDDDAWGYSPDQVQLWKFHADWVTTGNSSFTKIGALPVAAFDTEMCGGSRNCIPQPGGIAVDAIADRLMYRMQYRNFGAYQTLILNHTVDVDNTNHAGIRWYELRNSGAGWSVYQQGTFAPDSNNRWMASAAMNGQGEIGLGYSISSATTYPSIRYTGRTASDPLGQMTLGEGTIINGSGWQDHSSGRWGDYSSLSVDPTDDCTFWYTQEYYTSTVAGNASWQTRVGKFQLTSCGAPIDNPPSVSITNPAEGATVSGTVNVTASATDDHGVSKVEFFVDNVSVLVDNSAPFEYAWNTTTVADGAHTIKAVATDTANQTGQDVHNVTVANAPQPTVLHVGDLDGVGANANSSRWNATVTIYVHDTNHTPLSGVTVSGSWSNGTSGTSSCTTDSAGKCQVSKNGLARRTVASVTFSVTNLTKTGYTYNSAANHDPDGDSNGTAIVVNRP
jgi:hypothetical protein